jgi:hypothetical protein
MSSPKQGDRALVRQAVSELVHAGLAFYEDEEELLPVLRLISGEIFRLEANRIGRIK